LTVATALERSRAWKASRRRFVAAVKETCGCIDCGTHAGRLDFDHRPGTVKEFNLAHPWASWARLLAEIDKCDVRCIRCHAIRHAAPRRGKPSGRPIQSHCKRGHSLLDPDNVYVHSGRRICMECKRQRLRDWRARHAASL
jgi:hypothetical protein